MDKAKALDILRNHNEWRRGADIPMQDPKELGKALDIAISVLEQEKNHAPKNMRTIKSNLPIDEAIYEEGFISGVKSAAMTWEDIAKIITIYEAGIDNGDYRRYNDAEWMKEYSQDILRKFNEIRKK